MSDDSEAQRAEWEAFARKEEAAGRCPHCGSDYFNSLPQAELLRLAPLLEEYRQLGFQEARAIFRTADAKLSTRMANTRAAASGG